MKWQIFFLLFVASLGCGKGFLKTESSSTYSTSATLNDLENALKNTHLMAETPVAGEQSADDYYLTPATFDKSLLQDKNLYVWRKDIYAGQRNIGDWNIPYQQVDECNRILSKISAISPSEALRGQYNEITAAALFFRSYALYNISQVFTSVYDSALATQQLGISMPLKDSLADLPPRSSMKDSYEQIIQDLLKGIPHLSREVPKAKNYPGKPAAFALLARIFLSMRNYQKAGAYADSCLKGKSALMNFNSLDLDNKFPLPEDNQEVLYRSWMLTNSNIIQGRVFTGTIIDSNLYRSYDNNDIRKAAYFMLNNEGLPIFRSNYNGNAHAFSGLSVDEIYLIKAECCARRGDIALALSTLNHLLERRFKTGTFKPLVANSQKEAIALVLLERRKELVFRGLRWSDLRRLNKEEAKIVLTRYIKDSTFQLPPEDPNYDLPIPDDALENGIIIQNIRR